ENLRRSELVDLRGAMAAKRRVLEPLARTLFEDGGSRRERFKAYVRDNPAILDYAAFRAATDRHGVAWQRWPQAERDGSIGPEGGDRGAYRYHCYAQWLAAEQVARMDRRARAAGARLYFDVPLGVHPGGYDVWRERE